MQIEIDIDPEVYLPKYRDLRKSEADIYVLWGGRDSGKSHYIAQQLVEECLELEYFKCILSRKIQDTIRESQFETIKDVITQWGLQDEFEFRVHPLEIRCKNGNRFIARGADAAGKVKGVKDPTHAWFEELNQMTKEEYSVVSSTLRSTKTKVVEYWSFNPETTLADYRDFWLYEIVGERYETYTEVKEQKIGKETIGIKYHFVHSTYEDNEYCPPERKAKYLNTVEGDDYLFNVWIRGFWGERLVTRPFAHAYDESKHVGKTKLLEASQMIVVVDFNIDPFCANVFQVFRKDNLPAVEQVSEIEVMNGSIPELADRIKTELGPRLTSAYISGDAMGTHRRIDTIDHASLFMQLITALKISKRQLKIAPNPPHGISRDQVNYFLKHFPHFVIDDSCQGTRRDMRTVQVDLTNHIVKRNRNDLSQRADFIDNVRYLVNTFFRKDLSRHQKSGKWI